MFVYGVHFLEVCDSPLISILLSLSLSVQLGQLPEFGSGRGLSASLNRSSTSGGFQDLNNALESLLEDNSVKKGGAKTGGRQKGRATKTRAKESTSKCVIC